MASIDQFRERVVRSSLGRSSGLKAAIRRMVFVQADPIRCPARAQDLILRHRVDGYQAGDLERLYPRLGLEECFLYAYGFVSKELWRIVHPRRDAPLPSAERDVLGVIAQHGAMQPKALAELIGDKRVQNYWGGYSRSAKVVMESLHSRGALRVAHRVKGNRVYELAESFEQTQSEEVRFKEIVVAASTAMGATTRQFLLRELSGFGNLVEGGNARRRCLDALIAEGRLRVDLVGGVEYVAVVGRRGGTVPEGVRFLAPFDPIVRDRARFEHLWNWRYRFEAYVPKNKRQLGYYAMPVLWRDQVVGWVNATVQNGRLTVALGYVAGEPDEGGFRDELEAEVARLARFLGLAGDCWEMANGLA